MRRISQNMSLPLALTLIIGSMVKRNVARHAVNPLFCSFNKWYRWSSSHRFPGLDGIIRIARACEIRELAILALETAAAGGNEITHRECVRSIAGRNEFSPARISFLFRNEFPNPEFSALTAIYSHEFFISYLISLSIHLSLSLWTIMPRSDHLRTGISNWSIDNSYRVHAIATYGPWGM